MFPSRLGCSTISFRHQDLATALDTIGALGFVEIDLGALPGVCDHVPFVLDADAVESVTATVRGSGLRVRSVNGDIGDLNKPLTDDEREARAVHLDRLLELAAGIGAKALVLPCGALSHDPFRSVDEDLDAVATELMLAAARAEDFGVEIWTESLHFYRLCSNLKRATQLTSRLGDSNVRVVMDFSHIVAGGADPREFIHRFGERIAHVHLRDAVEGNINLSIGRGAVDFAAGLHALAATGYTGHFSLELETRDISHDERPAAAVDAAVIVSSLL